MSAALDFPDGKDMERRKGKKNSLEGRQTKEGNGVEKVVETPIFIPYTKESRLRKQLQELDDTIGEATNSPGVRFVERCGGSNLIDILTSSNPWAKEWSCGRKNCLPCHSRQMLAGELEERPLPELGKPELPRPSKEDTFTFPKCTTEGAGYSLECWECRLIGKKYMYIGETSRSPYQRGKEHENDVEGGKKNHPMTIHFKEKHQGRRQRIIMRVIATPKTSLARQIWESVKIDTLSGDMEACLNLKSEWGLSRTPGLQNKN